MPLRLLLPLVLCCSVVAGEAAWADRSGQDAAGSWAEIDVAGTPLRLRWRTFAHGEQAWLGEAPVPPQVVKALIPDIPDPRSLRWRAAQDIADAHAICAAIESTRPRLRCLLPRLSWLQESFPRPVAGWPRLWSGDLMQGYVAYEAMAGTRFDDLLASRLWGPPWSAEELREPAFPVRDPDGFGEEERYAWTRDGNEPPAWIRPVDRIGRGNDGAVPLAALRRLRKNGEPMAIGEPEGAALGLVLAVLDVRGAGAVAAQASADEAAPRALIAPGHSHEFAVSVSIAPDGRRVATANPDGVRLWDLGRGLAIGTLRRQDGLPMQGGLMAWNADGSRLFTAGDDGHLACWEAGTGALVWRSDFEVDDGHWTGNAIAVAQMATSNVALCLPGDGRLVRVTQVLGSGGGGSWCMWYDAATGDYVQPEPLWTIEEDAEEVLGDMLSRYRLKRVADGTMLDAAWRVRPVVAVEAGQLAVCDGASLRRWRLADLEALGEVQLHGHEQPRADALLTALDAEGRSWLFHDSLGLASVIDASGAVRTAALGECGLVRSGRGFAVQVEAAPALRQLVPGAPVEVVGSLPPARGGGLSIAAGFGPLQLLDGEQVQAEVQVRAQQLVGIAFPAPGSLVIAGASGVWRIDLASLQTVPGGEPPPEPPMAEDGLPACAVSEGVWRLHPYGEWVLSGADDAVLRRLPPDPLRRAGGRAQRACATAAGIFVASDGASILCREADGALRWWRASGEPPESPVRELAVSPDGRLIASLGESVALWRAADGALLCRFAATPGGPVAVTADGHYAMRGDPGPFIAFRWGGETWPVTEFDLQRNRPDLVAAAIGLADGATIAALNRAWEGRCRRLGVSPSAIGSVVRLPRALLDHAAMPLAVDGASIDLAVRVDAVPAGSTLVVRLDEVPVPTRVGAPISGALERRTVALVPGMNRIAVSVRLPDGREGLRDSAWVVSRAPAPAPRLHLLAVGCSRYRQSGIDLEFAAKDARDLAAGLGPATAALVLDQEATREGIAAAAQRLRMAAPHDTVVVFFAGHGVLDDDGNYWFLTHDADPKRPAERALAYAAIEELLESCPSRRRVVLLDTCHAGELDGEGLVALAAPVGSAPGMRARGLRARLAGAARPGFEFLDLRSGIGAAVLASSAGAEFALESAEWSNGVFTMAVLEGWARGRADADGDGAIRVAELSAFVAGRVAGLTGGAQNPALRSANRSVDTVLRPAK